MKSAEQQGGKSGIKFSYRIVAKRKDIRAERFKKVKLPDERQILKLATTSPSSKPKKRTP